jgi:hypothetical protein
MSSLGDGLSWYSRYAWRVVLPRIPSLRHPWHMTGFKLPSTVFLKWQTLSRFCCMEPFQISEGLNICSRINVSTRTSIRTFLRVAKHVMSIKDTTPNIKDVELKLYVRSRNKCHIGRFIVFSVITNIYNKKTKGHTSVELFTATRNLKRPFIDN